MFVDQWRELMGSKRGVRVHLGLGQAESERLSLEAGRPA
jgi:hypothetical protein